MRLSRRHVLVEQIGAGGMGTVWRAWDRRERRWVAAKVLARPDGASLERFVREQRLRVRHRHVVQPTGCAAYADRALFTMDLVRGGSAADLLRRHGPLPEDFVRVLLEQLLEALDAVHAAGVVHRDVKPANLLLEPTGDGRPWLRLGDFGVAAVLGDPRLTEVRGAVGTEGYMAPEQAWGATPEPRQDLYAVGVCAASLLGAAVPGPFSALVDRLRSGHPADRPATATEALHELRSVGVPAGAPWRSRPGAPVVPDTCPGLVAPGPPWWLASAACFGGAGVLGGLGTWLVVVR